MSNSVVKLTLESNQYERGMRDATKFWKDFTNGIGLSIPKITAATAAIGATTAALKVAKDAFFNNEEQLDEWGRTVESSESIYKGFLNALNTGDISGYLMNINNIVKAARDAYDALDELNTFNAFNQIQMQQARTGFTEAMVGFRMGERSKEDVQKAAKAYQEELRTRMEKEKDAYSQAVRKIAAERGVPWGNLEQALSGKYGNYQELKNIKPTGTQTKYTPGSMMFGGGVAYEVKVAANAEEKMGQALRALNDIELESLQAIGAQARRTADEIAQIDKQMVRVFNARSGGGGGGRSGRRSVTYQAGSLAAQQAEVQRLTKLWQESGVAVRDQYLQPLVEAERKLQQMRDEMTIAKDLAQGKLSGAGSESFLQSMRGATGLSTKFDAKSKIQLDEKAVARAMADAEKQTKRKEEKEEKKYLSEGLSQLSGGLGGLQSGFAQLGIDLGDGFGAVVGGLQAITTILMAIQTLVGAIETISALDAIIPFAGGGIVKAAGGTIVGRSFSGDNLRALGPGGQLYGLNAGEVVLNRAQVNNVAGALTGNGMQNLHLETYLDGRAIRIVLNNESQGRLKGKYVTSRRG